MKTYCTNRSVAMLASLSLSLSGVVSAHAATKSDFKGARPEPIGKVSESVAQLKIHFPESMIKAEALNVSCTPSVPGYSSWANNNATWTYNFKANEEYTQPRLAGGTKCAITQTGELTSESGKVWKAGTLNYEVIVPGPNVTAVYPAYGFSGALRESEPVVLITFDGPVDREKFFANQSAYFHYTSSNAPREKLPLTPVPEEQREQVFAHFKKNAGIWGMEYTDNNWVLATTRQNLITGSTVALKVEAVPSAAGTGVTSDKVFRKEFSVRNQFEAEIRCASQTEGGTNCFPMSPITVAFNGKVKWSDAKNATIKYRPYKSETDQWVTSYPKLAEDQNLGLFKGALNTAVDFLSEYAPSLAKYNETLVESITFDVNIEPETMATVTLPNGLKDIDGRELKSLPQFNVYVQAMKEMIQVPQHISFFEKNVPNVALPVGIVNLNQMIVVRKSGSSQDPNTWAPIQDMSTIVNLIRAYEARGEYRETLHYTSPMESIVESVSVKTQVLEGKKNRETVLEFPFSPGPQGQPGGLYAIEVSSPTYEQSEQARSGKIYHNPPYVLAQVTDLAVTLKKGQDETVAWVTRLSDGQPVANADVEIYNCLGQIVAQARANESGIAKIANKQWAQSCAAPQNAWSSVFEPTDFYAVARSGTDFTFTHSSWRSPNSYALGAPGVEWFHTQMTENRPYFHSIVGVNLVKPGQKVPIQIVGKIPQAKGFADVPANQLPTTARIVNWEDREIYYPFELKWNAGTAELEWQVPSDTSVKIGRYYLEVNVPGEEYARQVPGGDIEVAEFKVPLMSGIIGLPSEALIKPEAIPVTATVRYAKGVGAKDLPVSLAYYFEPTSLYFTDLPDFTFGNGEVKTEEQERESGSPSSNTALPSSERPVTIEGLRTNADGTVAKDIAAERLANGQLVREELKTADRPQKMVVRVRYQDQSGEFQTLSQAKDIYNSKLYVGTNLVSGDRNEARLRAAVVDVTTKKTMAPQNLELKIFRVETKVIGEELFGGMIKNTIERELKPVNYKPNCSNEKDILTCPVGALKEGVYAFQASLASAGIASHTLFKVDSEGRVHGRYDYFYFGDEDEKRQLPLALDKESYNGGEKALVSFPAPFKSCAALVSLERQNVIEAFVVPNACEKGAVEVPVDAEQAPNVFVSVYAVTGRTDTQDVKVGGADLGRPAYRLGFANIKVDWKRYEAKVNVALNKEEFKPGEMVEVNVNVQPEQGQLTGTKVTVVALEEKILELRPNETYKVLQSLMQMRGHGVETVTPLGRIETVAGADQKLAAAPAPEGARKGGGEGGDGMSEAEYTRKLFDALVAFETDVPVKNGVAQVKFKTNDSLTRFKVFAIAMDESEKFGTGEAVYLTAKDTQTQANIPPVARTGDQFPIRANIQNNGAQAQAYSVEAIATVKDSNGNVIDTIKLTSKVDPSQPVAKDTAKTLEVGQVKVAENAARIEYKIRVYDEKGNVVDSLEPEAQQVLPAVPLAVHDSFILQMDASQLNKPLTKDPKALPGKGEIRVSVSDSLVQGALSKISSRLNDDPFADFFVEGRIYKALLSGSQDQLKKELESLIAYLDRNGFVKYYPQAASGSVWLTAAIINVLGTHPGAMDAVPSAVAQKWKNAISLVLTKSVNPDYIGKSPMNWMRAQVLMGQAAFAMKDEGLQDAARIVAGEISAQLTANQEAFGEAMVKWNNSDLVEYWLLQVLTAPEQAKTSPAYDQLTTTRLQYTDNIATLRGQPHSSGFYYSDETIETAKLLSGHSALGMDRELARGLAKGLVNSSQTAWYVTRTLAWVGEGLMDFGHAYEKDKVAGSSMVSVAETKASTTITWGQKDAVNLVSNWPDQQATVQVNHAGQGKPWVSVEALEAIPLTEPRSRGLAVEKEIRDVKTKRIIEPGETLEVGTIVEVTLNIHASSSVYHVAMIDPIPGGSNILADAYGAYSSGEKTYKGYRLYFSFLSQGMSTVKYQYQLNNPGTFKLPPTRAEGLYMPSMYGESPNPEMTVILQRN